MEFISFFRFFYFFPQNQSTLSSSFAAATFSINVGHLCRLALVDPCHRRRRGSLLHRCSRTRRLRSRARRTIVSPDGRRHAARTRSTTSRSASRSGTCSRRPSRRSDALSCRSPGSSTAHPRRNVSHEQRSTLLYPVRRPPDGLFIFCGHHVLLTFHPDPVESRSGSASRFQHFFKPPGKAHPPGSRGRRRIFHYRGRSKRDVRACLINNLLTSL